MNNQKNELKRETQNTSLPSSSKLETSSPSLGVNSSKSQPSFTKLSNDCNIQNHRSTSPAKPYFAMKFVAFDWYMTRPQTRPALDIAYSHFRGASVDKVPILRLFGATEAGQKCTAHIHGALPYFFVPCPVDETRDLQTIHRFVRRFGHALERAMDLSCQKTSGQYIHEILVVSGREFYGFSSGESLFLKIYFYNPSDKARLVQLVSSGAVLSQSFQPYEAHVPFHLQISLDFDLSGMDFVLVADAHFRAPLPQSFSPRMWIPPERSVEIIESDSPVSTSPKHQVFTTCTVPSEKIVYLPRSSHCEIEVDILAKDIINAKNAPSATTVVHSLKTVRQDAEERRFEASYAIETPSATPHNSIEPLEDSQLVRKKLQVMVEGDQMLLQMFQQQSQLVSAPNPAREQISQKANLPLHLSQLPLEQKEHASPIAPEGLATGEAASRLTSTQSVDNQILHGLQWLKECEDSLPSQLDAHYPHQHLKQPYIPKPSRPSREYSLSNTPQAKQTPGNQCQSQGIFKKEFQSELLSQTQQSCQTPAQIVFEESEKQPDHSSQSQASLMPHQNPRTRPLDHINLDSPLISTSHSSTDHYATLHTPLIGKTESPSDAHGSPSSSDSRGLYGNLADENWSDDESTTEDEEEDSFGEEDYYPFNQINLNAPPFAGEDVEPYSQRIQHLSQFCANFFSSQESSSNPFSVTHTAPPSPKLPIIPSPHASEELPQFDGLGGGVNSSPDLFVPETPQQESLKQSRRVRFALCPEDSMEQIVLETPPDNLSPQIFRPLSSLLNKEDLVYLQRLNQTKHLEGDFSRLSKKKLKLEQKPFVGNRKKAQNARQQLDIVHLSKQTKTVSKHKPDSKGKLHKNCTKPRTEPISFSGYGEISLVSSSDDDLVLQNIAESPQLKSQSQKSLQLKSQSQKSSQSKSQSQKLSQLKSQSQKSSQSKSQSQKSSQLKSQSQKSSQSKSQSQKSLQLKSQSKSQKLGHSFSPDLRLLDDDVEQKNDLVLSPHSICPSPSVDIEVNEEPKESEQDRPPLMTAKYDYRNEYLKHGLYVAPKVADTYFPSPKPKPPSAHDTQHQVHRKQERSQVEAVTHPSNLHRFKFNAGQLQPSWPCENLTLLSLEVHTECRPGQTPDPKFDRIAAVFFCIRDDQTMDSCGTRYNDFCGILALSYEACQPQKPPMATRSETVEPPKQAPRRNPPEFFQAEGRPRLGPGLHFHKGTRTRQYPLGRTCHTTEFENEEDLLMAVVQLVRLSDPDMLVGFEIQKGSWGYIIERAATLQIEMCELLSRTIYSPNENHFNQQKDRYGHDHQSGIHLSGRVLLNIWRIMRSEVALQSYTFENCVYHCLHQRIPHWSFSTLHDWFPQLHLRPRVFRYFFIRAQLNFELLFHLEVVSKTCELARLFGIDFFSVLSRGSQYRVESMVMRIAKWHNYIMVSPSKQQVSQMPPPECIPLVMEPESKMYNTPVLVLDFRSLYPSIMIAYNLCYSTCLGKLNKTSNAFGALTLDLPPGLISSLHDKIFVAPNDVMFVKKEEREGIFPQFLREILQTRFLLKTEMKEVKIRDPNLYRKLNFLQQGLKMIANVTYGYTSAGFSGRMPCIELADAIVQTARQTLENTIRWIESSTHWNARVVYGDTDSVFVSVGDVSKERAFEIGEEIVRYVTNRHPAPIKLQFEKVYLPCVLMSKKRYVGYMFENPSQKEPTLDSKGIETVRRDTCPLVSKVMEKSLRLMFDHKDISCVENYVKRQFVKVLANRVSLQDLIFGKEVRLGGYVGTTLPPGATLAMAKLKNDPRSVPHYAERIPYVIAAAGPNVQLFKQAVSPEDMLRPELNLIPDVMYYIKKQMIPSLSRVFGLMGVSVQEWFQQIPKNSINSKRRIIPVRTSKSTTIDSFFRPQHCVVCRAVTSGTGRLICDFCEAHPQDAYFRLCVKSNLVEERRLQAHRICSSCEGDSGVLQVKCASLDCPVFFERKNLDMRMDDLRTAFQFLHIAEDQKNFSW